MSDIFTDNIYPHKGKIKEHFKDFYDTVFISFLPFFKVDRQPTDKKSYPSEQEIYETGKVITWATIIKDAGLADYSELNKALRTSIGALRQVFRRPQLTEKLNNFTDNQNIWHPTEGGFDTLSKVAIYKTFKLLRKNQIVITDEFYETTSTLELDKLTDIEFARKVGYKDYYLYSADKEILFTIEWDSFFFIIATRSENMEQIIEQKQFEGFLCNEKTEHTWDYEEGEIQKYLDIEAKQKALTGKRTTKKQWWKF